MATAPQIEANRLNAQKSTGPRTPEGKARSSMNALKSGLDAESQFVHGENPADFALLQQRYFDRFRPDTPEEAFYVDSLIRNEWILRRLNRAEAHLWEYYVIRANRHERVPLGEAFATASLVFMRLQRRLTATERSYNDAAAELARLQAARQPAETTPETACLGSFLKVNPFEADPLFPVPFAAPKSGPPPGAFPIPVPAPPRAGPTEPARVKEGEIPRPESRPLSPACRL